MKKVLWVLLASFAFSGAVLAMEENLLKRTREDELVKDNPSKETPDNGPKRRVKIRLRNPRPSLSQNMQFDGSLDDIRFYAKQQEVLTPDDGNWSLLHAVAKAGNSEQLKILLNADACLEVTDEEGRTPLHIAVIEGKLDCVRMLLQSGANKDAKCKYGSWTPLHFASKKGWPAIVHLLLKENADWKKKGAYKERPLHVAASYGKIECLKALIKITKNKRSLNVKGCYGTPLYEAVENGHRDCVNELIQAGAKAQIKDVAEAAQSHPDYMEALVRAWSDVNQKDMEGNTALILVVGRGDKESVKILIEAGADLDIQDKNGYTALILAAKSGSKDIVELLVNAQADLDKQSNLGTTALMHAAKSGSKDIVELFIKAQADLDKQNENGDTALIVAAKSGSKDIVELLVNAQADPNKQDKNGYTALIVAAKSGSKDIVELLVNAQADLDKQNKLGVGALMWAAKRGYKEIVEFLIKAQADPNKQNKNGDTALIVVAHHGYKEIVKLLIEAGAAIGVRALAKACLADKLEVLKLLLDNFNYKGNMSRFFRWVLNNKKWGALLELVTWYYAHNTPLEDTEDGSFLIQDQSVSVPGVFFRISGTLRTMVEDIGQKTDISLPGVTQEIWNLLDTNMDHICSLSLKVDLVDKLKDTSSSASHERVTIQSSNEEIQEELARLARRRPAFRASNAYKALKKELADHYQDCTRKQASQILSLANYLEIPFLMDVFADVLRKAYVEDVFATVKKEVHKDLREAFLDGLMYDFYKMLSSLKK